jgi:hypothetical protein
LVCKSPEIYFYFVPLSEQIRYFITILLKHMVFEPSQSNGSFSERFTGEEFKRLFEIAKDIGKLIFLEYFSDSTQVSSFGNKSVHPVQVTLGNLPHHYQNTKDGSIFVGFLPNFDNYPLIQDPAKKLQIIHKCWEAFFHDLKQHLKQLKPIVMDVDGKEERFMPFLGLYRGDTPEIKKLNLVKDVNTGAAASPCSMCTIPGSSFDAETIFPNREDQSSVFKNQTEKPKDFERNSFIPKVDVIFFIDTLTNRAPFLTFHTLIQL